MTDEERVFEALGTLNITWHETLSEEEIERAKKQAFWEIKNYFFKTSWIPKLLLKRVLKIVEIENAFRFLLDEPELTEVEKPSIKEVSELLQIWPIDIETPWIDVVRVFEENSTELRKVISNSYIGEELLDAFLNIIQLEVDFQVIKGAFLYGDLVDELANKKILQSEILSTQEVLKNLKLVDLAQKSIGEFEEEARKIDVQKDELMAIITEGYRSKSGLKYGL